MNRHKLPLARHASNEQGGWVKIGKQLKLSHKPMGLASMERVTVYKTRTLLYFTSTIYMPNSVSQFDLLIIAADYARFASLQQNCCKCFLNSVSSVIRDLAFAIRNRYYGTHVLYGHVIGVHTNIHTETALLSCALMYQKQMRTYLYVPFCKVVSIGTSLIS